MQRCRSSRATSAETSRDVRSAASKPITRTGLLYWPSNKSSTTLSMVSSIGGIRHADGGGIGRSPAAAATLHCTMNTWGFLPLSSSLPGAGSNGEAVRYFNARLDRGTLFNAGHSGYVKTVELRRHGTNVRDFGAAPSIAGHQRNAKTTAIATRVY